MIFNITHDASLISFMWSSQFHYIKFFGHFLFQKSASAEDKGKEKETIMLEILKIENCNGKEISLCHKTHKTKL